MPFHKQKIPLWVVVLIIAALLAFNAFAARNSSGTYSLPSGNPVVTGTTITSTWANTTLNDIKTEITNSLDRQGRGAMLAPLQIVSGTAAAPGLTGSAEPSSGLYRNAAGDWRFSVLTVPVMKWTTALVSSLVPLTVTGRTTTTDLTVTGTSAELAVVSGTANTRAISATGNGNGSGVNAFGGSTSGKGVSAAGGAPNGMGISGEGAGSGVGVFAVGGNSGGAGLSAIGGATGGIGVLSVGDASSPGVDSTGGPSAGTGVIGRGGITNGAGVAGRGSGSGAGVVALGGATGIGVLATAGTSATGATRQVGVRISNGDIDLDSVVDPDSTTAITNQVTPKNIAKAWGTISISGATVTIEDGFNVSGGAVSTNLGGSVHGGDTIDITFASAFANANYAVALGDVLATGSVPCHPFTFAKSTTVLSIQFWRFRNTGVGFAATDIFDALCVQNLNSPPYAYTWTGQKLSFVVYGAQ